MKIIADFHIHSHFSIATSSELVPEHLDLWARMKGIHIIGSGDFTHPGWTAELREKLEPAENGLFRIRESCRLPESANRIPFRDQEVRFLLSAEISTIYKKNKRTRKVHHVILAPDFETVQKIQNSLIRLGGNITSDGRPILGLDSRDLLEICLEASEHIAFIPAHVWTPWFSVLGDKSGFDSIEECYEELTPHIFAVETGLSSDPPMNRLCSILDRFALVSNSDAHSPQKLGRECNLFDTDLSYPALMGALKSGDPDRFLGTVEFFPQEGKYHHDGHRKCGVNWHPLETDTHEGKCSECGKPVTVGVMHRVMELADRDAPKPSIPHFHLIPLKEILSEILGVGPQSKSVDALYNSLLERFGPELTILRETSPGDLANSGEEELAEAIRRMRSGQVHIREGYDGEFGRIFLFSPGERRTTRQKRLFSGIDSPIHSPPPAVFPSKFITIAANKRKTGGRPLTSPKSDREFSLNPEQLEAVEYRGGPLLVLAGPGTGKTHLLVARILRLLKESKPGSTKILAVTFTNKAAREMRERLTAALTSGSPDSAVSISTFHGWGYAFLKENAVRFQRSVPFSIIDEEEKNEILRSCPSSDLKNIEKIAAAISIYKRNLLIPESSINKKWQTVFREYEGALQKCNAFDLDDLIRLPALCLSSGGEFRKTLQNRYQAILVDEYQDIDPAQYRLIRELAGDSSSKLTVVGDPNQSIYGFRGASASFIKCFLDDFPGSKIIGLQQSYRCSDIILAGSGRIVSDDHGFALRGLHRGVKIQISKQATDRSEAEFVARTIEEMLGGVRFFSLDSEVSKGDAAEGVGSLSDFAILCRTSRQMDVLEKALSDHGLPSQRAGEIPYFKEKPFRIIVDLFSGLKQRKSLDFEQASSVLNRPAEEIGSILREIPRDLPVKESLESIMERFFPESPADSQIERNKVFFLEWAVDFGEDIDSFLYQAKAGGAVDTLHRSERINLLTMHAAKGLEFSCVFIVGCEDGLIPYSLFQADTEIEEEKRLLYVGMTRSRNYLFLSHAEHRRLFGRKYRLPRSPFLDRLEKELIETGTGTFKGKTREEQRQPSLFPGFSLQGAQKKTKRDKR